MPSGLSWDHSGVSEAARRGVEYDHSQRLAQRLLKDQRSEKSKDLVRALQLFEAMQSEGIKPHHLQRLINACKKNKDTGEASDIGECCR